MRSMFVCVLMAMVLSGCSTKPDQGPFGNHTSDWYASHHNSDKKELSWCKNDMARMKADSCANAEEGANKWFVKQQSMSHIAPGL